MLRTIRTVAAQTGTKSLNLPCKMWLISVFSASPQNSAAQNRDHWAEEKAGLPAQALGNDACRKAMGDDRNGSTPWFLLESDQERREALLDPARAWHNMRCWVDKACVFRKAQDI
ncbi:hypothetical protein AK812_SmicGene31584 [Symbiodinium microadriaticum]|uniref:Uncharacterized protein n=1 Tax=Symbiodinium microadriaticum TaxID=2951 RepID=A0A1Q9CWE8_SYMMI|nr:hypothetical protein AK812_SmicGene31584 [Symbiodinium microadriaticum]